VLIISLEEIKELKKKLTKTNRVLRQIILKKGKPDWDKLLKYLGDLK
jgi:ribosomal protein S6